MKRQSKRLKAWLIQIPKLSKRQQEQIANIVDKACDDFNSIQADKLESVDAKH